MSPSDPRLQRLFGDGASAFRTAFDLVSDPVGVLWAIRERSGAIVDVVPGYSNPAMARMIGVPIEASIRRRVLEEAPGFTEDRTYRQCVECSRRGSRTWSKSRWRPADGVLKLVSDVTERRRIEAELRDDAKVAAHDLREPIMAAG